MTSAFEHGCRVVSPATGLDMAQVRGPAPVALVAVSDVQLELSRHTWAVRHGARTVAVAGIIDAGGDEGELWAWLTPAVRPLLLGLLRRVKLTLPRLGYRCVHSIARTDEGARMLWLLGFEENDHGGSSTSDRFFVWRR